MRFYLKKTGAKVITQLFEAGDNFSRPKKPHTMIISLYSAYSEISFLFIDLPNNKNNYIHLVLKRSTESQTTGYKLDKSFASYETLKQVGNWHRELLKYRANERATAYISILNLSTWPFQVDCML